MDIDWIVTLWSALVVVVATTVHGITGFGTGQITMGVLPFFRDAGSASIVVSIVVFITNLRVFWSVRDEFNWKDWIIPVAGLAAGLPIGIYLFGA
ncbi:MAG: sulfite exporter TauE/SafE family protein, partial [Deltaproteobacteria bacterium]